MLTFKLNHQTEPVQQPSENLTLIPINPSRKLSALLVEDAPLIQRFSAHIFEMLGCNVTLASTGKEAIQLAKQKFDIIFMDIGLPDQDGLEVMQEIRAQEKDGYHTPIVALTAHADKAMEKKCVAAGADGFLPKPASAKAISQYLQKYQQIKPVVAADD